MRHQIALLAVAGLVPNALAQSSSMDMSMSMPMSGSMSMSMSMPTSTISIPCLAPAGVVLGTAFPSPSNDALSSFINDATSDNITAFASSPCAAATSLASAIPSSLRPAAASYQSQLASYVAANAADVSDVYRECAALAPTATVSGVGFSPRNITEAVNLLTALADTGCVKLADATASGVSASASATASESSSRNAAAGARPTGVAVSAVAAVGVLGAVALL
ncbi:hypothetical protein F5B19DRAFT_491847 [Rostrohypoxylon terebratum]|nr:hypothetical protein F5B19DRAFT_491847 [Rostrohypoxylon terebratum]